MSCGGGYVVVEAPQIGGAAAAAENVYWWPVLYEQYLGVPVTQPYSGLFAPGGSFLRMQTWYYPYAVGDGGWAVQMDAAGNTSYVVAAWYEHAGRDLYVVNWLWSNAEQRWLYTYGIDRATNGYLCTSLVYRASSTEAPR